MLGRIALIAHCIIEAAFQDIRVGNSLEHDNTLVLLNVILNTSALPVHLKPREVTRRMDNNREGKASNKGTSIEYQEQEKNIM